MIIVVYTTDKKYAAYYKVSNLYRQVNESMAMSRSVKRLHVMRCKKLNLLRREIMKRIAHQLTRSTALITTVAVLVAFFVLVSAGPSFAAPKKSAHATGAKALTADHVEARIKYLHSSLKITPEQEPLWKNVTQVMLDNAKTMEELIKVRAEAAATVTPVDDLKSYSAIADGHADGLKKFIPAFEALYAGMSEEQQKNAHKLFHDHRNPKSKAKSK